MYEDRTYDNIMSEMMSQFGGDVRTDEGSLAFNACARQAEKLEDVYQDLEEVRSNLTPDTMDLDHLISYAPQVGIAYKYATPCVARGVFTQEIPSGTQFSCGEYTYTSGSLIPDTAYNYLLICDIEGTAPNTTTGELELETYIDDFEGGSITEVLVPGTDDEDEEEFRERVIGTYGTKAFGGNKADYQNFIDALDNVGACKPKRRTTDSPWINIWLLDSSFGVPSASVVSDVQEAVDPTGTTGEGDGMAPICHHVQIIAATGVVVNISATLTLSESYTISAVKDSIERALAEYFLSLRQSWEDNALLPTVVRVAQIEAKILTVTGVLDVSNTRLNGSDENLTLTYEKIPLMGEVTLNV